MIDITLAELTTSLKEYFLIGVQLPDHHEAAVERQEVGLQGQVKGHLSR